MMNEQDLIVLGGGLIGKTTALALSQKGFKVLHVAQSLAPKNTMPSLESSHSDGNSRVYAISSSSQKLLEELQVWGALPLDEIQAVREMRIFGDSAQEQSSLQFSAFEAAVPQLAWIMPSNLIENAIDLVSRFSQNLERVQAEVLDIQIQENHTLVKTTLGDYASQLVIAADGANSPTRERFGIEVSEESYHHTAVIANLSCSQTHLQTAYQWFLPGGDVLALLPLPGKKVSLIWSTHQDHAQVLVQLSKDNPTEFCQRITQSANGLVKQELGELTLLNEVKSYPLKKLRAKHLIGPAHDPRIVLVGDAAHVMHPLAGQGLNLGFRDIADLSQVLANKERYRSLSDPVLLRRYERMRAGDINAILGVTHHLHQLFLNTTPTVRWMRNLGMKMVNNHPILKRQLIARALG